ncbi:MAG: hypothetical protein ACM30G_12120 [Micromonosporaceae bacterium]
MTDTYAELDAALDRVVSAARAHLDAVKAAADAPDDDAVWRAYVQLNNACYEYDEQLNDIFGEVTPWDLEEISPEEAEEGLSTVTSGDDDLLDADDPHPQVVSVRQRRDYRVPSVAALLRSAEIARFAMPQADGVAPEPVRTVGEAVLELLQAGDGSLGMLDVPELEPLDGLVIVAEVESALDPEAHVESDAEAPFRLGAGDRAVGRLDERPFTDVDDQQVA